MAGHAHSRGIKVGFPTGGAAPEVPRERPDPAVDWSGAKAGPLFSGNGGKLFPGVIIGKVVAGQDIAATS